MVKKTPAYKNKLKAMEFERTGGVTNKKKGGKQANKYALDICVHTSVYFKLYQLSATFPSY